MRIEVMLLCSPGEIQEAVGAVMVSRTTEGRREVFGPTWDDEEEADEFLAWYTESGLPDLMVPVQSLEPMTLVRIRHEFCQEQRAKCRSTSLKWNSEEHVSALYRGHSKCVSRTRKMTIDNIPLYRIMEDPPSVGDDRPRFNAERRGPDDWVHLGFSYQDSDCKERVKPLTLRVSPPHSAILYQHILPITQNNWPNPNTIRPSLFSRSYP